MTAAERSVGILLAVSVALSTGCSTPLHLSDIHVTSVPRPPPLDAAALTCGPVTTLGMVAPGGIQGLSPTVAHALVTALSTASPPIRAVAMPDTLNRLGDRGLIGEYGELLAGYGRTGIMDRDRLRRIGAALGSRYLIQPGLAEFSQSLVDKFEFTGLKIVRTRVWTLRVWLQLWDAPTGHLLWESTGEITAATPVLRTDSTVSLDDLARQLWSRMLAKDLLEGTKASGTCA